MAASDLAGSCRALSLCLLALSSASDGEARIVRAATVGELQARTASLVAGDTLLVSAGTYDLTTWSLSELRGRADAWIVIRAEGKAVVRGTSDCCNLVQIENVHYLELRGFELTLASPGTGGDGVNVRGTHVSHLRMADLYIHHVVNNGISLFADSADHVELVGSEISHATGSGLYWGYPGRDLVRDVLIQGNHIHHCPADPAEPTGYGIQFKGWGHRARILDNVLHDVGGTSRSGLIVYYGKRPLAGDDPADINVVAGNALWNCRNEGITAMSDARIENNVVFDAAIGINLQTYSDESFAGTTFVENLTVRNNTVFRCRSAALALSGWSASMGTVVLAANAAYQGAAGTAISGQAGKAVVEGNIFLGASSLSAGAKAGAGLGDFMAVAAADLPPALDFYPSAASALLAADGDAAHCASADFNGAAREGPCQAGAYHRRQAANPGWKIQPGFKALSGSTAILARPRSQGNTRLPALGRRWPASRSYMTAWTLTGRLVAAGPGNAEP